VLYRPVFLIIDEDTFGGAIHVIELAAAERPKEAEEADCAEE